MSVGEICQRAVDTAEAGEEVRAAAQRMRSRNVGSLVILDGEGRPIGIVTDRDLALRVVAEGRSPSEVRVREVMTAAPHTIVEDTSVEDALASMRSFGVRRLPVVDAAGRLVGLVSLQDILALLAQEFGQLSDVIERTSPRSVALT